MRPSVPKILIVDDYKANRLVLKGQLSDLNAEFLMAKDGQEALDIMQREYVDLVLLDIMMPGLSGVDVLKEMDKSERLTEIPVMMITAMEEDDALAQCLELGASDYITKPVKMPILKARVYSQLTRKWALDTLRASRSNLEQKVEERTADMQLAFKQLKAGMKGQKKARAAAQQAQLRFQDAIDALGDGFALFDAQLNLELANDTFFYFYNHGEPIERGVSYQSILQRLVDEGLISAVQAKQELEVSKDDDQSKLERELHLTDKRWFRVSQRRTGDGSIVSVFSDITEWKALEYKLRWTAQVDPLTKMYNRRKFLFVLNRELERWGRYREPLSLLMIDIDSFKQLNGKYGYPFSDQVLAAVADQLRGLVRSCDTVARWGDEKFIILLPSTSRKDGIALGKRICKCVSEHHITTDKGSLQVTISLGSAVMGEQDIMDIDSFIQAVDSALYQAKDKGRNQLYAYVGMDK